jgi:RNA ligase
VIPPIDFIKFPKIARLNRDVIVTEKLDGTNAQVYIDDVGENVYAGSRTRWIQPGDDNFGFAKWVQENRDELIKLGPGSHFGEWWGSGIQRSYGLKEKRFSLFNVKRWSAGSLPACCGVVPTLWEGLFADLRPWTILKELELSGSVAAPGFMKPEGIVVFHVASNGLYKMTLDKNDQVKGNA